MRLDDFDPNSVNIGDQRGSGFSLGGTGGRVGCGSLVIALIAALVFGVDPTQMLGGMSGSDTGSVATQGGSNATESCTVDAVSRESCNALSSLNKTWAPVFEASKVPFTPPRLVFYSQMGRSGCGAAQSAMGPFYCPNDQSIYIDTDFYRELEQRLGAGGDFARNYVIAHEYGHHIQQLVGMADQVRSAQQANPQDANALQVAMELQADCYAGVWAGLNRDRIDPGDLEEGLNAAHSIGDDVLTGGRVAEASFTHGSAAQRMQWLRKGIQTADEDQCDTFGAFRG
jgi:predicted metalloprotease